MTICTTLTDARSGLAVAIYEPDYAATVVQPTYAGEVAPCDESWGIAVSEGEDAQRRRLNLRDGANMVYWLLLQEEF